MHKFWNEVQMSPVNRIANLLSFFICLTIVEYVIICIRQTSASLLPYSASVHMLLPDTADIW